MREAKILYAIIVHDSNARRGRGHRSEKAAWRKGALLWDSLDKLRSVRPRAEQSVTGSVSMWDGAENVVRRVLAHLPLRGQNAAWAPAAGL